MVGYFSIMFVDHMKAFFCLFVCFPLKGKKKKKIIIKFKLV